MVQLPPPILTFAAAAAGVIAVFIVASPSLGGYDVSALFAWHPVLLTAAVLLAAPMGVAAYSDGPSGPLSQLWPRTCSPRSSHLTALAASAGLAAAGYAAGYIAHEISGKDHLALARGNSLRTMHVWFGLLALAALSVQVAAGLARVLLSPTDRRVQLAAAWHSRAGRFVWALSASPLALAVAFRWLPSAPAAGAVLSALMCIAAWRVFG